ncbi:MAG: tetratricopeptide repeat protein [Candidatus Melainabacteria bacterium]|nr:MAG: tetratricopeptide repeat protein [Candidatus Melainabacteria bacterium]
MYCTSPDFQAKMTNVHKFIYTLAVAMSIQLGLATEQAFATKLNAAPLPHERDSKDFSNGEETVIPPSATRFKRRPDAREVEKQQKADELEAQKNAALAKKQQLDAEAKAQQQQIEAYNKQAQIAIEANNSAVALGKQGRWMEAIAAHEKAVQYDPKNKQFRVNLSAARTAFGQQRMAQKDYAGAASMFRKALSAAPDNGLAGKMLVECMKKSGLDATNADVRIQVGDQLAGANDFEGAAIEYQAAMQIEPSGKTYVKMGDMAYRYGQITTATNWYRQAIIKDPNCGAAHRQLGFLALAQRDNTSAAASLRKAVILDPKDVAAGQQLVEIWRKQVATNPLLAENHLGLAGALQLTGDFVGAESSYRKLEALDPKNPGLEAGRASLSRAYQHAKAEKHKLASTTLYNQGLRREALAEINQAVMLEPRNAEYQFLLGECLEANGDYQNAHQAYLTCVLIDPENNKEAAARMKAMQNQSGMTAQQSQNAISQVTNRLTGANSQHSPLATPQAQAMPVQTQQTAPAALAQGMPTDNSGVRKNMFEGGSGSPTLPQTMNFRTHDESEAAQSGTAVAAAPGITAPQTTAPAANDNLAKVSACEAQKDYAGAVTILRQLLSDNLQNPDIHHRLAVNLMSAGEISEAISEFRIASALNPKQKAYAEDLARAMSIHKRSMTSDGAGAPQ